MIVKKFEASTIDAALKLVRDEFGPDAIIIQTKNHRKGFGLLAGGSVEITAAISEESLQKKKFFDARLPQKYRLSLPKKKVKGAIDRFYDHHLKRAQKSFERTEELSSITSYNRTEAPQPLSDRIELKSDTLGFAPMDQASSNALYSQKKDSPEEVRLLRRKIAQMEAALLKLRGKNEPKEAIEDTSFSVSLLHVLLSQGVSRNVAQIYLGRALSRVNNLENEDQVLRALVEEIENSFHLASMDSAGVHCIYGPSGAGKTSFLLKWAMQLKRGQQETVIINADQEKLIASTYLKSVGKIASLKVFDFDEVLKWNGPLKDWKHILVDMPAALPHKWDARVMQWCEKQGVNLSKDLVVPASMSLEDVRNWALEPSKRVIQSLNITKLDEVSTLGSLLNYCSLGIPFGYFTSGRKIPGDIERANVEKIISLLV